MQMMLIDCSTFLQFHVAIVSEVEQSGVLLEALREANKSHRFHHSYPYFRT